MKKDAILDMPMSPEELGKLIRVPLLSDKPNKNGVAFVLDDPELRIPMLTTGRDPTDGLIGVTLGADGKSHDLLMTKEIWEKLSKHMQEFDMSSLELRLTNMIDIDSYPYGKPKEPPPTTE